MKKIYLLFCALLALGITTSCSPKVEVKGIRVEMLENPVGVGTEQPRFMWQIASTQPDVVQTSYRITVASNEADLKSGTGLVWDSGEVASDNTLFIPYEGAVLESRKEYFWKVDVKTNKGAAGSNIGKWEMALREGDWKAGWIGLDRSVNEGDVLEGSTRLTARYLRKDFTLPKRASKARIYISGVGFYECYINGKKAGEDVFAPTATDYTKHVNYNVYDVTDHLQPGDNTIGVILGNGRYFSMRLNHGVRHFGFPKLIAQLEVDYEDGSRATVSSDDSWKITTDGPIIANNEFDGEEYDARLEMEGWSSGGFNDSEWLEVEMVEAPGGKLVAQSNPNIRIMKKVKPVSIEQTSRGTYILDMGQNMVGWLGIALNGQKDKPVKMVFAELLKEGGDELYLANLRSAKVTDVYTPAKDGAFSWEPRFTYHGFRFVEITGLDYQPELSAFTGKVIYDKMDDKGTFVSSNETLNRIFENAYWGIIGNYRSMPTDCPQRDERMGWLGDRAIGCYGESFMVDNALLYNKWIRDIADSQHPGGSLPDVSPDFWDVRTENVTWPSAFIFAINMLYEQYGDVRPVKQYYGSMKKWIEHMTTNYMTDHILWKDNFGDWCMPPERQELIHSEDPARKTDGAILSTTFFYRLLGLMSKYALINDIPEDKAYFDDLAEKMRDAYNEKYLNKETGQYGNNTVTANILSLMLGLTPAEYQDKVFANVIEKTEGEFDSHVSTGLVGIQQLMRGLTKYGRPDLAYTIATNTTYPSWGYMIDKGATTIWELWNGDTADPAMNSANHVMLLGDLLTWYYENLAGIATDKEMVGFKKINMAPIFPTGLDYVNASYESVRGPISSHWQRKGESVEWAVSIPANTSATVTLPAGMDITSSRSDLRNIRNETGLVTFDIPSGNYTFTVK